MLKYITSLLSENQYEKYIEQSFLEDNKFTTTPNSDEMSPEVLIAVTAICAFVVIALLSTSLYLFIKNKCCCKSNFVNKKKSESTKGKAEVISRKRETDCINTIELTIVA